MIDAGIQVSDDSKNVIADLLRRYLVWKNNFLHPNFDLKTFVKMITRSYFTQVFLTLQP